MLNDKQRKYNEISNTIPSGNSNNKWVSICNTGLLDNDINKKVKE